MNKVFLRNYIAWLLERYKDNIEHKINNDKFFINTFIAVVEDYSKEFKVNE